MELNISSCYNVFDNGVNRVAKSLNISNLHNSEIESYITHRALIIFKLDLILIEHRNSFDKDRFVLFGKNALYHYLFLKKGVPLDSSKKMSFHDILIVLWDDISAYNIPSDVLTHLHKGFYFNNPTPLSVRDEERYFQETEWNPEDADRQLNR
ncbi:hypothetical protein ABRQ07_11650 [Pectobacterium polonicum]|uniref:Uncharacterized protein n=1 Tax=Pectobacterium polonicum TaxID=2485124 RepID=A0ABV1PAT3_9GAMM|nr:hypothetical protein [Pectobacterium polonicum]MDC9821988.1 hypothetical protein [Pectobacterium polonicum]